MRDHVNALPTKRFYCRSGSFKCRRIVRVRRNLFPLRDQVFDDRPHVQGIAESGSATDPDHSTDSSGTFVKESMWLPGVQFSTSTPAASIAFSAADIACRYIG